MTTTEDIRIISLNDFKYDSHMIDYVDENIVILDNIDTNISRQGQFRLGCFLMVFCLEGKSTVNINGKSCVLEAEHCAIMLPNTLIRHSLQNHRCKFRIVAISVDFLKEIAQVNKNTWNITFHLYHNPIFPINRNSSYRFYLYKELALASINEKPCPFLKNAKKHLFSAIFCELLSKLHEDISNKGNIPIYGNDRSSYIFRKFMELVSADDGSHRSVSYYADKLCYSSKHLSTVIKKICGKAPLTIINEHAMDCIKYKLKHSDKSIKEVASHFNFENPSFFGKFVKTHTGMSPLQYRNSEEAETGIK